MLVYEIQSSINKPTVSTWFKTEYTDEGSVIFNEFIKQNCDNPNNWRKNHPNFNYNFTEFIEIKNNLDFHKNSLNFTLQDKITEKKYTNITNIIRNCEGLRGSNGHISIMYNAEIVSNAWLKMYEICGFIKPFFNKYNKINSFHLAEAPGNFIIALNHYIKTLYPYTVWNWNANTFNARLFNDLKYLKDSHNLEKIYSKHWDYGCDMDGDITSINNINFYEKKYKKEKINLITSDAKYVSDVVDFNNEEIINIPVHTGQIINSLFILSKGGTIILKHFTFLTAQSLCLIKLVKMYFEKVYIIKPISSKPANSETYLVCSNYIKYPTVFQKKILLNYMNYIKKLNNKNGCPCLFKNTFNKSFVDEVVSISKKLADSQIIYIKKNLNNYLKYKDVSFSKIWNDFKKLHNDTIDNWVETNNIKILENKNKLIK